jgi:hypothetical protein
VFLFTGCLLVLTRRLELAILHSHGLTSHLHYAQYLRVNRHCLYCCVVSTSSGNGIFFQLHHSHRDMPILQNSEEADPNSTAEGRMDASKLKVLYSMMFVMSETTKCQHIAFYN